MSNKSRISQKIFNISLPLSFLFIISCGGGGGQGPNEDFEEGLSDAALAILDNSRPEDPKPLSETYLDNGMSIQEVNDKYGLPPIYDIGNQLLRRYSKSLTRSELSAEERKTILISRMVEQGKQLAKRDQWKADPEGPDSPAQYGLAYVWGGKRVKPRDRGKDHQGGSCPELLYGIDCSGLTKIVAEAADLSIADGASVQWSPKTWNNAIPDNWGVEMVDVTAEANATGKYQTGDIVGWKTSMTSAHIGIIDDNTVIQSNGKDNGSAAECRQNYTMPNEPVPHRGPNAWDLKTTAFRAFGGKPTTVLRLRATENGHPSYIYRTENWWGFLFIDMAGPGNPNTHIRWGYGEGEKMDQLNFEPNCFMRYESTFKGKFSYGKIYTLTHAHSYSINPLSDALNHPGSPGCPIQIRIKINELPGNKASVEIIGGSFPWMIAPTTHVYHQQDETGGALRFENKQVKIRENFQLQPQ